MNAPRGLQGFQGDVSRSRPEGRPRGASSRGGLPSRGAAGKHSPLTSRECLQFARSTLDYRIYVRVRLLSILLAASGLFLGFLFPVDLAYLAQSRFLLGQDVRHFSSYPTRWGPSPVSGAAPTISRALDPQTFDPQTVALPVSRPDVNPLLLEASPYGWIPVRSASGLQAWQTYRHPAADTYEDNTTAVFLALVLLDVGISHRWTEQALRFPDLVTLGLSPYAANIEDIVLVARNRGHEIVLALPLQAGEDVLLDPGPLVLSQTARGEALQDGLARLLSRVAGYMCVYNATPSPARFDSAFMGSLVGQLDRRGLCFLDALRPGSAGGGSAASRRPAAPESEAPFLQADWNLPATEDLQAVLEAFETLEQRLEARPQGGFIATVHVNQVILDHLKIWLDNQQSQGLELRPLSSAFF